MHSLAAAIERLSAKWSLPARNVQHLDGAVEGGDRRARAGGRAAPRRPPTRLWPSSPMASAWPIRRGHVDRLRRPDGGVEDRPEHLGHPAQPVDDLRRRRRRSAAPCRAPRSGWRRRAGRRSGVVGDLPDRHRRGDHARHRADGPVVVARLDGDLARGERPLGLRRASWPSPRGGPRRPGRRASARTSGRTRSAARRAAWCAPGPASASIAARAGRMPTTRGRTACTAAIAAALAAAVVSSSRATIARAAARSENAGGRQSSCVTSGAGTPSTISGQPGVDHLHATGDHGRPPSASAPPASRIASRAAAALEPASSTPASRSVRAWASKPCGSAAVPQIEATNAIGRSAAARASRTAAADRACWVGVGAVAEHDVEQHHADRRVRRGLHDPRRARRRIDHRVRSARGVLVVAEVDHLGRHPARPSSTLASPASVPPVYSPSTRPAGPDARRRLGDRGRQRDPDQPGGLDRGPLQGAAHDDRRRRRRRPRRAGRPRPGCRPRRSSRGGRATARRPPVPAAWRRRRSPRPTDPPTSRSSASSVITPPTAAERSRPPTPISAAFPTPARSSRHDTSCAPVPEAATMPTGPGRSTFANPSGTPSSTAVPQSGPIISRRRRAASALSRTSSSTGTLSEKHMTCSPRRSACSATIAAYVPGTDTVTTVAPGRLGDALGDRLRALLGRLRRPRVGARQRGRGEGQRVLDGARIPALHGDQQVVRPGSDAVREHVRLGEQAQVRRGRHHHAGPHDVLALLQLRGQRQQRHRVPVEPGEHRGGEGRWWPSSGTRPDEERRPGSRRRTRWPDRGRRRRPTGAARPARRAPPAPMPTPARRRARSAPRCSGRRPRPPAGAARCAWCRQQRRHGRAEPSVRARVAEQVEPGEHATDDVVAGRGGARCRRRRSPRRMRRARRNEPRGRGGSSSAARSAEAKPVRPGRRVGQATIELGELRRGDAGAVRGRDAQLDRGRGGVPRPQVDRRRPVAVGELGPAGEDRGEGGLIGHAESTRHQAGGARGHRDERAGPGGEQRGRLSDIDDGEGIDIGRAGQRPIAAQAGRRRWTIGEHR